MLPGELRPWAEPVPDRRTAGLVAADVRRQVQEVMTSRVGVLRTAAGLDEATARLDALVATPSDTVDVAAWETTNLLTISAALADAATRREETRGSHWREDHPERDDADWAGHLDVVMRDGVGSVEFHPEPASDALVAAGATTSGGTS